MKEERKKILKMVEDGLISSEEAEELLDALDEAEKAEQQQNVVSTKVNWEEGDKQQQYKAKANKKSSIFGFVEEAFQKIKNVDFDLNFGKNYEVSHIFHHHTAVFHDIDFDIANGNVTIQPWNETDVRVECKAKVYQVDNQEQAREKFHKETFFLVEEDRLQFSLQSQQVKAEVIVKVPERHYRKVVIKLFNGSFFGEEITGDCLLVKSTNGSINLSESNGTVLEVETANGTINISDSRWEVADMETINGKINVDGTFEKIDAQLVNGSISCLWHEGLQPKSGFFKTTTGSVRLVLPDQLRIDGKAETKIGNIHCDLAHYQVIEEKKEVINRSLHFEVNQEKETEPFYLEAETKTGSVWMLPTK
ncbi:DUF4097 family beta strand repeat-containing protein [Sediminibacillus halophilus]|uniref:DUF4097 and DUF4098 domain-containing protein YvlB n=1 Tax=Sediminibacillus halophilus TaxID=482461 RepID=A0A1G9R9D3_9BACI|nr:DUF4097 domain-containing protein [Sediminibacillus halophilus]SDM19834.1 DUF4097 and DUF4098 domain-containing protein YvlB [Sediminibacillus halophilus]